MSNNWNEGWEGYSISQIAEKAKRSQHSLDPNIILLHAGTNDLNESPPVDPSQAPDRLGALIDQIIADSPDAIILVAQIINAANPATESLVQAYNNAVPGEVKRRADSGHKIMVSDFRSITAADLKDGIHPTDAGYQKMADIWFKGIQEAAQKDWIKAPKTPDPKLGLPASGPADRYCLQPPFWVEAIKDKAIATGVGHNGDLNFHPNWVKVDSHATGIGKDGIGVVFADLNGDSEFEDKRIGPTTDELPPQNEQTIYTGSVIAYLNSGSGDTMSWNPVNGGKEIASGVASRERIRFVDIGEKAHVSNFLDSMTKTRSDMDGKDDYVVMGNQTVSATVYLNRGPKQGAPGSWIWDGPYEVAPGAPGARGGDIVFADINNDGRPDYLVVDNKTGAVGAFLNIGKQNTINGIQWIGAGQIANGFGSNDIAMKDMTGDGRAEYLQWSKTGGIEGYLNFRTEHEGQPGWGHTIFFNEGGLGKPSTYNRLADFNGDGKADYAQVSEKGAVTLWLNKGSADTSVIGDGVHLADLDGDGRDDYVSLASNAAFCIVDPKSGAIILYKNGGPHPKGGWIWVAANEGKPIATGLGPGRNVRLADMDGDGKADYLILGPRGEASLYLNKGEKTGGWNCVAYNDGKPIATGIGFDADHVQFKDINGDKKADYIGIPNGKWLWIPMNNAKSVATGVGAVGADVRWGRMEKTGRYSYLALSPNTGALQAWLNGCNQLSPQVGGSSGSGSSGGTGTGNGQGTSSSDPSNTASNSGGSGGNPGDPANSGGSGDGEIEDNGSGDRSASNDTLYGDSLTGGYLGGGKEIPAAGLTALGLTTIGIPAVLSLTPYAITAQNDLTTAHQALEALAVGAVTSGGVLAAASAVEVAAKDFGALSQQSKAWDLNSFSSGLKDEAQKEQKALQDTAKSLSDLVPRLRECGATLKRSDSCPTLFKSAAGTVGGKSAVTPLTWFTLGNEPDLPPFLLPISGSSPSSGGSSSTSGGPGSGSGGSASGSGSGGPNGFGGSTLGGGLPFPKGGLHGLGLPTRGATAINGLKPYAISTQNAVSKALGLLNGLSGGASTAAADVSAAAESLAAAGSDFIELSTALGDIELSSVPGGQIFEAQQTRSALQSLAKQLGNALPPLRGCISNPGICRNIYRGTAGLVGGASIGVQLDAIINYDSTGKLRPTPVILPNSTTTSTSLPTAWILNTIPGTSVEDFRAFIKTLPDRGSGKQMIFDGSDYQNYVTKMTKEEALIVNKAPIVDMMTRNDPRYQQMISAPITERISFMLSDVRLGYQYHYEQSSGLGSYVYVFDGGFEFRHPEFDGQTPESYFVPGLFDDNGLPVADIRDDMQGHGTACAAAVGGNDLGIAKNVKIIGVKFTSNDDVKPEDMIQAWRCAIRDARTKNRLGKTVFSMSWRWPTPYYDLPNQQHFPAYYRPPFNIPPPRFAEWWPPLLVEAWKEDIVTVFSTGNRGGPPQVAVANQGSQSPTRFCKANNPCIGVGSVEDTGQPSPYNLPIGPNPAYTFDQDLVGENTVFAHGSNIRIANIQQPDDPALYKVDSGTSFATPQIAGLAAYFLSLPNSVQPPPGEAAMAVKQQLVRLARDNRVDAPKLANNGVWDTPCGALTKREKAELLAMEAALALEKLKGVHLVQSLAA
ncbi:MAG: hypothetical protein L6R42_002647 [Xanthoria sp. 1 TBL-2021]|nr:MAG: hypothetical protein L6R42_002647 [Xanthoria sp. 1 TBL-2021]